MKITDFIFTGDSLLASTDDGSKFEIVIVSSPSGGLVLQAQRIQEQHKYVVNCASCRATTHVVVKPYPQGPRDIKACPICGTTAEDNLEFEEVS